MCMMFNSSGSKKSLTSMFSSGNCHPKMAMVIDDRLKVWEDQDQPQVHVVPAFAPYYAPQAEVCFKLIISLQGSEMSLCDDTVWFLHFRQALLSQSFVLLGT